MRYLLLPQVLSIAADLRLSHTRLDTELGPRGAPVRSSAISNTALSLDATFTGERVSTEAGFAMRLISGSNELGGLFQDVETRQMSINHLGCYYEPEFRFGALRVRSGLRLQWFAIQIDPMVEPRLRMVWDVGRHAISGAFGIYHQEIVGLNDKRDAASVFTAWTNIPKLSSGQSGVLAGRIPRAIHGLLGYRAQPAPWLEVSVEAYVRRLRNLFVPEWNAFPELTTRLQPASGRTFGFDTRLEIRRAPFYGFVNYGLSSTRYEAEQASLQLWYGEETLQYRPPHDRRHQVNALLSTTLRGIELTARWEFGSGMPFSRPLGFDGFVLLDDDIDVSKTPYRRRVIYERPYNALLPTYHRLDLSAGYSFSISAARLTMQGTLINAYDRRNLFYLDVYTLQRADQLPFVPSLGLKVAFE
jgi:hypothetical protein